MITDRVAANKGTTSAYAENTAKGEFGLNLLPNYLRVRGEYSGAEAEHAAAEELPPRTRRIPGAIPVLPPPEGTTSAYAENTL